jgi:hypothetical protein
MFRNQYIICNGEVDFESDFNKTKWSNELIIYSHKSLTCLAKSNEHIKAAIIGYIIDPFHPDACDADILNEILYHCVSLELLFKNLQKFSGRYVLLYSNKNDMIAVNDSCALRQIYYNFDNNNIVLTSSLKLYLDSFSEELITTEEKINLKDSREFKICEHWWIGENSIDNRFKKLLPNNYLDLKIKKKNRIKIFFPEYNGYQETVRFASNTLKGSINAISKRYNIILPITAGWDSRTILAASKEFKDLINYYIYDYGPNSSSQKDVLIAKRLCNKLGINLKIIEAYEKYDDKFMGTYNKEYLFPRIQSNTMEIQHAYLNYKDTNTVRVSGVTEEIVRCYYGFTSSAVQAEMIDYFTGYRGTQKFISREIEDWLQEAQIYSKENNIPILDLFYWEQRVGNWATVFLSEEDIAIEEFPPMNNKNLILSMLQIHPKYRSANKYLLIKDIIEQLWSDALAEPINPASTFKMFIKNLKKHSKLRYNMHKIFPFK